MNNPSQSSEAIREPSSESPLNPQTPSQNTAQNSVNVSQASNIQPNIQPAPPVNSQNPPEQVLNQSSSAEANLTGEINPTENEDDPNSKDPKSSDPVPRPPQTLDTVIKNFFQGRGYPIDIPTAASISTQLIANNPQPAQSTLQNSSSQHHGFQNSGFKDTGALASTPSNNFSNDDEFAEVLRQHALSSQPSDYSNSYLEYRNWAHNSLEMYKTELSSLLYPLFIHSYLDLLYRQEISEARSFFEKFYEDHTTYFSEDLQKFKALTLSSNPMDHELVKTFRGNKFGIKVSKNGFRLMIGHLSESPYLLNLRIINKWVNVVVTDAIPDEGDPRGCYIGITGHIQQELNQLTQEKLHLGKRPIPPEMRSEVELLAKEEDQAANPNKEDPNAEKAKSKEGEATTPTTAPNTNQYKDAKTNSLLNTLKRYYEDIDPEIAQNDDLPLPPYKGADTKRELEFIKDLRHRISLGGESKALPSICCYTWHNSNNNINCTTMSDNLNLMAIGTRDSYIGLYSLLNEPLRSLKGTINPAMVKDASDLNRMRERGLATNRKLVGHSGPVFGMSFSQDNQCLLSCSEDKTVRLWSLETYQSLVVYKGHNFPIWDVDFSPTSYYFATASLDRTSRLWSTDHPSPLRVFTGHLSDVDTVKFHPNSKYLMTGSTDKTARLWDVNRGSCVRVFTGHTSPVYKIAVSPDGKSMATAGIDNSIMVWDLGSGRRSYHFELGGSAILSPKTVHSLEFSADSNVLFSADSDCSIKIWDVKSNIENIHQDADQNGIEKNDEDLSKPKGLISEFKTKGTPIKYLKCTRRNLLLGVGTFSNL